MPPTQELTPVTLQGSGPIVPFTKFLFFNKSYCYILKQLQDTKNV